MMSVNEQEFLITSTPELSPTDNSCAESKISVGLSQAFENKQLRPGYNQTAYGDSFTPSRVTRVELVDHILRGNSWMPGYCQGKTRRNKTWRYAEVIALDADDGLSVAEALTHPLVQKYAMLVHPTASSTPDHPRTRIIFVLSEPVDHVERYRSLVAGLIRALGWKIDSASCKPVQPYHGSTNRVEAPYINYEATLPLSQLDELTDEDARGEDRRGASPERPSDGSRSLTGVCHGCIAKTVDELIAEYANTPAGIGRRHQAFICLIAKLIGRKKGGWEGYERIEDAIRRAGQRTDREPREIEDAIRWAESTVDPIPLRPPELFPPGDGDVAVELKYISDLNLDLIRREGALIARSDMGTGKTQLVARLISQSRNDLGRDPRVLVLTHRKALSDNLTDRLNASGEGLHFECYLGLKAADLQCIDQLVICLNSLHKLVPAIGEKIKPFDLVIIDESEQVLAQFGGGTLTGKQALNAHELSRALVNASVLTVALDAHAGEITREWLIRAGKESPQLLENQFIVKHGPLTLYQKSEAVLKQIQRLLEADDGPVVIAASSLKRARALEQFCLKYCDPGQVRIICSENASDPEVQAFIRDINQQLPQLRVLIYTSSLGTGVDIQCPVRAVCGFFDAKPLDARDMHQMLNRCRHRRETHVFLRAGERNAIEDARVIYDRVCHNAYNTKLVIAFDNGEVRLTPEQERLTWLTSACEAAHNRSTNHLKNHFLALAQGYEITGNQEEGPEEIAEEFEQIEAEIRETEKQAILDAQPVNDEEFRRKQQTGTVTAADRAGHKRYRLEALCGQTLTPEIYDRVSTPEGQQALIWLTDMLDTETRMKRIDRGEDASDILYKHRGHRTQRRRIGLRMIRAVFGGNFDPTIELTRAEICARLEPVLKEDLKYLARVYGWRPCQSRDPLRILMWLLGRLGLKLIYKQKRAGQGKRIRVYSLDASSLAQMGNLAQVRKAYLDRQFGGD